EIMARRNYYAIIETLMALAGAIKNNQNQNQDGPIVFQALKEASTLSFKGGYDSDSARNYNKEV
ncbi:hypothetical protein CR513_40995, partial [Mucuna pruriens]